MLNILVEIFKCIDKIYTIIQCIHLFIIIFDTILYIYLFFYVLF